MTYFYRYLRGTTSRVDRWIASYKSCKIHVKDATFNSSTYVSNAQKYIDSLFIYNSSYYAFAVVHYATNFDYIIWGSCVA